MKNRHYASITCLLAFALLVSGCAELSYDPSFMGDAPSSPDESWKRKTITPPPPLPPSYTQEDLTENTSVSLLLDIALRNNPSTKSSWNGARAAGYGYHAAQSLYFPSVDYTGIITAQNSTVGLGNANTGTANSLIPGNPVVNNGIGVITGPTGATNAINTTSAISPNSYTVFNELSLNYLLFDFGGRDAQVELAKQTLYVANWQHNLTMQQVMLSVLTAYTSYIGNKGLVEAGEQNLKDAEVALKAAQVMHEAGLSTLTDVLQAQSAVEQARYNLEQARGSENTSMGQLLIAVGLPPNTKMNLTNLPQKLPVVEISGDINSLFELAKKKRPDIGAAIAAVKQQEAQLDIAYSSGMPTLSVNGILSTLHFMNNTKLDGHRNSISLELNYPVFQGFYYVNLERQNIALVRQAIANLDVQISNVGTLVVTNYYAFITAAASLASSEAVLEYSQRAYKGILVQYRTGTSSILDLLSALTTLSNARAQQVLTRTQWAASLANLAFSVGILEDTSADWKNTPPKYLYKLSLNLETAVQGDEVIQDFESESFVMGGDHSQKVKEATFTSDYGLKSCITSSPSTAISRLNDKTLSTHD